MSLFKKSKEKKDFIQMLVDQADKSVRAMTELSDFMKNPRPEKGKEIDVIEQEADDLRLILVTELNKAFVTPIDREDIYALSKAIDDMTDYTKSTVEEVLLFKITPDDHLIKMVESLLIASTEICLGLKSLKDYPVAAIQHLIKAKKTENFIEHRYREGLADLFKTDDFKTIFKMREIYRHLSNAADKVDLAADIVNDIIIKCT